MRTGLLFIFAFFVISSSLLYFFRDKITYSIFAPRQNITREETVQQKTDNTVDTDDVKIVAQNLNIPWEIAFLPNKDMLVTERPGKLLRIGATTKVITEIEGVRHVGEGGLLGLALHPNFEKNSFIYLYSTTENADGLSNRVERYKLSNDALSDRKVIIDGIKGSSNHDGGRIVFGPDGYLYITTGDAENSSLAQDTNSLNGKVLRIKDDGDIPSDNPFGNAVYSYGHRNPQGLAWDTKGMLWQTEHGPSGVQTGYDEVNIIYKGSNYGWPTIKGDQVQERLVSPIIQSGSKDTWAPSGMVYWDGSLFFSGLRGEALYEAKIGNGNTLSLVTHFKQTFGRIRAVVLGPDGFLYISTSNRDGRGRVKESDDKIIRINQKIFR
ncbi:MAG TPA: PQQ-dependent sugar dehydrogenase [Patescibacteria group bacterium]|nr:PQQ-dependent sugar dehydrogenase [Patescibacteria group bacterium]